MTNRIQRFEFIQGFGSFRDWKRNRDLPDFARYNLIYGWNGSGKSMLARLIRAFEMERLPDFAEPGVCDFKIELSQSSSLRPGDVAGSGLAVRVFSEDFVEENLQFDKASVSPLLILGKEHIEAASELDELREMQSVVEGELRSALSDLSRVDKTREKLLKDGARDIKRLLRDGPDQRFYTYDRQDFEDALDDISKGADPPKIDVDVQEARLTERPKPELKVERGFEATDLANLWRILEGILAIQVPDTSIASLRANAEVQDWVSRGVNLHKDRDERCLFCDQDMPSDRMSALRRHFTSAFIDHVAAVDVLEIRFREFRDGLCSYVRSVDELPEDRLYEELLGSWKLLPDKLKKSSKIVERAIDSCLHSLKAKKEDPFVALELPVSEEDVIAAADMLKEAVASVDDAIAKHGDRTESMEELRDSAQQQLEMHMVWEAFPEYLKIEEELGDIVEAKEDLVACDREIADAIRAIEARLEGTQHPCNELNSALERYFGHGLFTVSPARSDEVEGLSLLRGGEPAKHLSEGERAGIALVYFLLKLQEDDTELQKTIVVIDDPVSSLDDNSAYQAFGSMFESTLAAAQVIYLTHSFPMFRSLRERFLRGSKDLKKDFQMFMVRRTVDADGVHSSLGPIDPTLKKYDSEYHYLFVTLYRFAKSPSAALADGYMMPNIGRRVLETFFAFKKPVGIRFDKKVRECGFDNAKVERLLGFVNFHSHGDSTARLETVGALGNVEAQEVSRDLLALMEHVDPVHVQDMKTHVGTA